MWVFGHLGIGSKIVQPFSRRLPLGWILLGTLLPDLIDKPIYYGLSLVTGERGFDLGLFSCTRTIGHTAIFSITLAALAAIRRSKVLAALALGAASHLVLDGVQDYWFHRVEKHEGESSALVALLFPFHLPRFSEMPFTGVGEHLKSLGRPYLLVTEAVGLLLLLGRWRRARKLAIGRGMRESRSSG